jgi:hypothetical protein
VAKKEHAQSLAKLFKEENRKKLLDDPKGAVSAAGGPDALGEFLDGISERDRQLLIDTWEHMKGQKFTADVDGVTVAFL